MPTEGLKGALRGTKLNEQTDNNERKRPLWLSMIQSAYLALHLGSHFIIVFSHCHCRSRCCWSRSWSWWPDQTRPDEDENPAQLLLLLSIHRLCGLGAMVSLD